MDAFYKRYREFFYRWDAFEQQAGATPIAVIDAAFEASPGTVVPFLQRDEALQQASELISIAPSVIYRRRLEAAATVLEALEGKTVDYRDYVRRTQAYKVSEIPQSVCSAIIERALRALSDARIGEDWKTLVRYLSEPAIHSPQELQKTFLRFEDDRIEALSDYLGLVRRPKIQLEVVSVEAYWNCWISLKNDTFFIRLNFGPYLIWNASTVAFSVLHDVLGHACQIEQWREGIKSGRISPAFSLLHVFTDEQFSLEGVAQTLHLLLPAEVAGPLASIEMETVAYRLAIYHNAHYQLQQGAVEEEVINSAAAALPWADACAVRSDILAMFHDPFLRSYQSVYASSFTAFSAWAEGRDEAEKRDLLRACYAQPLSPEELRNGYGLVIEI